MHFYLKLYTFVALVSALVGVILTIYHIKFSKCCLDFESEQKEDSFDEKSEDVESKYWRWVHESDCCSI